MAEANANAILTVSLDEQSRRAIAELTDRLDFAGIPIARTDIETDALSRANETARAEKIPTSTVLLRMLVESEGERERTHGFVGALRSLEKQISVVRLERDTFSEQVDHFMRQVDACHAKIETLQTEADKSLAEKRELSDLLKTYADDLRSCKAKNRTVCVRDMFVEVLPHQERNDKPTVPSEAAIRLQTRIDCEEFVEKIEALYDESAYVELLHDLLTKIATKGVIRKDLHDRLPEFADALADNAVTNEGFGVLFGIDVQKVFDVVHKSNMAKKDGPIVDGKRKKPEGWTPPDVAGVLRDLGWRPSSESKVDDPIPYRLNTFDSLFIGGKPMQGVGKLSLERSEDVPDKMCELHGPLNDDECVRCENSQYNGSEIDPIAEGEAALTHLAKEAVKVAPTSENEARRHAIPIDRSLWKSEGKIGIPTALVEVCGLQIVCRVLVCGKGAERRVMIEFVAGDARFGHWERLRQDSVPCDISIDGSAIGKAHVVSVERGGMRPDGSYVLQIEFEKIG